MATYGKDDFVDETDPSTNCTIEVQGFTSHLSLDVLEMYFESEKRSGGGNIVTKEIKDEKLVITFEDPKVAQRVLKRQQHVLGHATLTVRQPSTVISVKPKTPRDKRRFLLKGLAEGTTSDNIKLYLESRTEIDEDPEIEFGDQGTIMVTYSQEIQDIEHIAKRVNQRQLNGATVTLERVYNTNCIMVRNLPKMMTSDLMEMYFENSTRSGGSDVERVEIDDDIALVYFEDYQVIDSVAGRSHNLGGQKLEVIPHHPCLGAPSTDGGSSKFENRSESFRVTVNVKKMQYVMSNQDLRREFEKQMTKSNTEFEWANRETNDIITLTWVRECNKLQIGTSESWRENAKALLESFLDQIKEAVIPIPKDIFDDMEDKLHYLAKGFAINMTINKFPSSVHVLGDEKTVSEIEEKVKVLVKEMTEAKTKNKEIVKLDIFRLKKLQVGRFTDKVTNAIPDVIVELDNNASSVTFEGADLDIKQAKIMMYESLEETHIHRMTSLTPIALSLLRSKEADTKITGKFTLQNLNVAYLIEGSEVLCLATDKIELEKCSNILKEIVVEESVELEENASAVLETELWESLKAKLQDQYLVKIHVEKGSRGSVLKITGIEGCLDSALQEINDCIKQNSIVEKSLTIELGMLKYLLDFNNDSLASIEQRFNSRFFKITKKLTGPSIGIDIKGTPSDVENAMREIKILRDKVKCRQYDFNQPGIAQHFTQQSGQRLVKKLESEFKCMVEQYLSENGSESTGSRLIFYSKSSEDIEGAIKTLDRHIEEEFVQTTLDGDRLNHLSFKDVSHIMSLSKPLQVQVKFEPEATGNKLRLYGHKLHVTKVQSKIDGLIDEKIAGDAQVSKGDGTRVKCEEDTTDEMGKEFRTLHSYMSEKKTLRAPDLMSDVLTMPATLDSRTNTNTKVNKSGSTETDTRSLVVEASSLEIPSSHKRSSRVSHKSRRPWRQEKKQFLDARSPLVSNTVDSSDNSSVPMVPATLSFLQSESSVESKVSDKPETMSPHPAENRRLLSPSALQKDKTVSSKTTEDNISKSLIAFPRIPYAATKHLESERSGPIRKHDPVKNAGASLERPKTKRSSNDKLKVTTAEGINIEVYTSDLTLEVVDVVVNSTNGQLTLDAGLAGALGKAAGIDLEKDRDAIINQRQKPLAESDCAHTAGHNLPCKYVIHSVGSVWNEGKENKIRLQIKETVKNCLIYAERELKATSIAIPAISTGINRVPYQVCAEALADGIKEFSKTFTPSNTLKEIRLVDISTERVNVMKTEIEKTFVPKKSDASAKLQITCEKTTIEIYKGDMTRENVDVIVNSVNGELSLTGGLALALAKAAGSGLQKECTEYLENRSDTLKEPEIMHTKAYNLGCKHVIHAVGSQWNAATSNECRKNLQESVRNCLTHAESKLNATSIAFPALNSGIYSMPKDVCAKATFDAITEFSRASRVDGCLREVHIVDISLDSINAMKMKFKELQQT